MSHATLTPAGLRAARLGAGAGPRLAALEGEQVPGWRDFRPWSYTPDSTTNRLSGTAAHTVLLDEHGSDTPNQPA